ncbi:hypothetical protein BGZ57DRAFT_1008173 [Hyaloscypha finlandica]|nr:hypothetical protein BGZ57DRAFT_1008173 [Hyaloscypha finlandica]
MSEWSLISERSSKAHDSSSSRSEDDFTVARNGSTISATVDLADSHVKIKEWLGTQSEDGAISTSSPKDITSTLTPSKETDGISGHPSSGVPRNPTVSQQPVSTLNTTPKCLIPKTNTYTLKISELPKTPSLNNPSYLRVLRHPSSWYSAVANIFNISKGEEEFWKDAEEAALRRLPIKMLWYWLLVPGDQLGVELDHDWRRSEIS